MKKIIFFILLPISLVMNSMVVPVQAKKVESTIRVGLVVNQPEVFISGDANFEILQGETGKSLGKFKKGEQVSLAVKDKIISINGKKVIAGSVINIKSPNQLLEVNKKQYRGNLAVHITRGKTGLTIVNVLPIEEYLYGVIAKEISPDWHLEAVKSQAVAARTYALYNLHKHQADDYDVCATNDCQVYGGRVNETPRVLKAVDDTAGQVLLYQGKTIPAYFHSSSGGYTENSENVWGTSQPYTRGVVDYDQASPHYKWEKKLTRGEVEGAMVKAGYQIGRIKAIELVPLTSAPMNTSERGVSGRVKVLRFIGENGSAQLKGEQVRTMFGLKSTLFDVSTLLVRDKSIEFDIAQDIGRVDHKIVEINLPPTKEQGFFTDKKELHRLSGKGNEIILISGFGWGHGLGLSQWGAKGMAEKGPQGDTNYYKEILKHYYQGITIEKAF